MKKYQSFLSENFQFLEVKFSIDLNRRVFVMKYSKIYYSGYRLCLISEVLNVCVTKNCLFSLHYENMPIQIY